MTYKQFQFVIEGISKKYGWQYKLSVVSSAPEAISSVSEEDFPLCSTKSKVNDKVFKMNDALALMSMTKG